VDWVNWISGKVSHAWSIIYALDEPLFDLDAFRWAPNLPESGFSGVFFPFPTYGDEANQYQFHVSYQGHYDEMPDLFRSHQASVRREIRETIDMLERESVALFPALKGEYHWRVAHAGVYGLAQSPGFVSHKRPSMRPPAADNLFRQDVDLPPSSALQESDRRAVYHRADPAPQDCPLAHRARFGGGVKHKLAAVKVCL
jgi:hypothetical protein